MESSPDKKRLPMGTISGVHGVKGWVKVYSYTQPRDNIVKYDQWYLSHRGQVKPVKLTGGQSTGRGVIAKIEGIDDREQALALKGAEILIDRSELPALPEGEYYWVDLEGLKVVTVDGVDLGTVSHLMETGANDVFVVKGEDRERLIPFTEAPDPGHAVVRISLEEGLIVVDWDPDF